MLPQALEELIDAIGSLPGIGRKSATRLALYLNDHPDTANINLQQALTTVKDKVKHCSVCGNLTESEICEICSNENREEDKIMVIESVLDLLAFEEAGYKGLYHILGGLISPLHGVGPGQLNFERLKERLTAEKSVKEVILALPTSLEGETTATYIVNFIEQLKQGDKLNISRLARGLPSNSALDYQDSKTLDQALRYRTQTQK